MKVKLRWATRRKVAHRGAHGTKMRCAKPQELQAPELAILNWIQILTGHFYINKF